MADTLASAPHLERRATARRRRQLDDAVIATTALVAAMVALPLARNSWHGPEVAAVLAVSATAMLAQQRWAIALVVIAELLLLPTLVPRVFLAPGDLGIWAAGAVALAALVPGVLAIRRAAAALVLVAGWRRTPQTCRRLRAALVASGVLATLIPLF